MSTWPTNKSRVHGAVVLRVRSSCTVMYGHRNVIIYGFTGQLLIYKCAFAFDKNVFSEKSVCLIIFLEGETIHCVYNARELLQICAIFFTEADGLKTYKSQTSENNRAPRGKSFLVLINDHTHFLPSSH